MKGNPITYLKKEALGLRDVFQSLLLVSAALCIAGALASGFSILICAGGMLPAGIIFFLVLILASVG